MLIQLLKDLEINSQHYVAGKRLMLANAYAKKMIERGDAVEVRRMKAHTNKTKEKQEEE